MAKTIGRWALIVAVVCVSSLGAIARADVSGSSADNLQSGSNRSTTSQSGKGKTGSAVGGQVSGVVSSGHASVDAKNTSDNSSVSSGDARGTNDAASFTGLHRTSDGEVTISDISGSCTTGGGCNNVQDGGNRGTLSQVANATTGDGVAGEVIGVVSTGSASVVAANHTTNSDITSGDAHATNDASAFVGLIRTSDGDLTISDVTNSCNGTGGTNCNNVQDGSNRLTQRQNAAANSGDGVGGQVIGLVSAGRASVDATNTSDGVDVTTGAGDATNNQSAFVGLYRTSESDTRLSADVTGSCQQTGTGQTFAICNNVQDGNNTASLSQSATSGSGDGVAGEVIGVVTSAGGSASVVAANHTKDSSVETGDATSTNDLAAFVGLQRTSDGDLTISDVTNSCNGTGGTNCNNVQNGNNRLTGGQSAWANSGDGVAGQVLGVVSAGAASVDASNTSTDSDVTSGDGRATNDAAVFVGLNRTSDGNLTISDVTGSCNTGGGCNNIQDGLNSKSFTQSANGTSGDAVAGQVSGVVTSAGGSASVVLANTSSNIDGTSGDGRFDNSLSDFVGLNVASGAVTLTP